jgi:hypothetical protein
MHSSATMEVAMSIIGKGERARRLCDVRPPSKIKEHEGVTAKVEEQRTKESRLAAYEEAAGRKEDIPYIQPPSGVVL